MPHELHVAVPHGNQLYRFTNTARIGRAESNDIVIASDGVSAQHVELRISDGGWEIVDLGSSNGILVDNKQVTRAPIGALTWLRLGRGGPELRLTIPALAGAESGGTRRFGTADLVNRYLSDEAPENMSANTRQIRSALRERQTQEASTWIKRIRNLRATVIVLILLVIGAAGVAIWQVRRVEALRVAAGDVFDTMKSLDLDIRRIEAQTGPDTSIQQRRARLETQYNGMLKTLGIYSDRTPADVQLIYHTVHRLGESEATVPRGFVDEVRKYITLWKSADLQMGLTRANEQQLGPRVSTILLQHNLPREFFYLALQESKFDPRAIGPSTRFGVPKGLWQLIPPTATAYGLKLGPLQGERQFDPSDDRHNVEKATNAAARYLEDIYRTDAQASGLLVMASYNMGEPRLRTLIRSLPESPTERNFWALLKRHRKEIPDETYNYVFRVVSAAVIGANPRLFGFDFDAPLGSMSDSTQQTH